MTKDEITVAEAARKLGVALTYVYSLLWAGKLEGRKINKQWRVSAEAVEMRLRSRGE
jgi:excisionase family DNA binding protein